MDQARTVYEGKPEDISVGAFRDHTPGYERDFVYRGPTFFTSEVYLRRDGALVAIDKPADAQLSVYRDLLLLTLRSDWTVGGRTYRAGSLLASDFEAFLKGSRTLDVLFEPTARASLASFSPTLHHILLNTLDNVRSRVEVLTRKAGAWTRQPLPGVPDFGSVDATAVEPDRSDEFFLTADDFLTPTSLSLGVAGTNARADRLKSLPSFFEAGDLAISQHEAVSKDGTHVPYFQVSRKNVATDGTNPTLLYGYGGFEISMTPDYGGAERGGMAREGRRLPSRQHPRRRRVRTGVAPRRPQGESPQGLRGLHRRRGRRHRAEAHLDTHTSASWAAATAACSWATCSPCGPTSSAPWSARRRFST